MSRKAAAVAGVPPLSPAGRCGTAIVGSMVLLLVVSEVATSTSARPDLESEMIALINADRASGGLPPLLEHAELRELARERSGDMIARNYFDHAIPPAGEMVFTRMDERQIRYTRAGENLGRTRNPRGDTTRT